MKRITLIALVAVALVAGACGQGNVFSLEVGTCFDDPEGFGEIADVPIVECSDPHDNEVYYLFDLPDGSFPGTDAVETQAIDGCLAAFEPFVGLEYQSSILEISWLTPTSQSWDAGDREIVCFLFNLNFDKLNGSMRGSGV